MYNNGDLGNANVYMCMDRLMVVCVCLCMPTFTLYKTGNLKTNRCGDINTRYIDIMKVMLERQRGQSHMLSSGQHDLYLYILSSLLS